MKKNEIEIGKKYHMGDVECEAVVYDKDKEVLMVREQDGNISFILGDFVVNNDEIDYTVVRSYMVKDNEFVDCVDKGMAEVVITDKFSIVNLINRMTEVLHNKYYKIPSYILEVVAQWYLSYAHKE